MQNTSWKPSGRNSNENEYRTNRRNHRKGAVALPLSKRRNPRSVRKEKPSAQFGRRATRTVASGPPKVTAFMPPETDDAPLPQGLPCYSVHPFQHKRVNEQDIQHSILEGDSQDEFKVKLSLDSVLGQHLLERFEVVCELGHGAFSTTYLAKDLQYQLFQSIKFMNRVSHQFVAIKRVKMLEYNPIGEGESELLQELNAQVDFDSRHVISPIMAFYDDNLFHLVIEPLDSGRPVALPSVCRCIPAPRSPHSLMACPSRQYSFQKLLCQLLSGLQSLHKYGFIHADLTPSNILYMTSSNRIKIIDLGNAVRPMERESYTIDYELQSAHYRAPEIVIGHGPIEPKIDIWSAGVIGIEWLLDDNGRQLLNKRLAEFDCVTYTGTSAIEMPNHEDSNRLLWVPEETREALVRKIITLFGSIDCYRNGKFYDWRYEMLSATLIHPGEENDYGLLNQTGDLATPFKGILSDFLLDYTLSEELTEFLLHMIATDFRRRKSAVELLREKWLVSSLLGEWANVLTNASTMSFQYENDRLVRDESIEYTLENDDSGFAETFSNDISLNLCSEDVLGPLDLEILENDCTRASADDDSKGDPTKGLHLRNLGACDLLSDVRSPLGDIFYVDDGASKSKYLEPTGHQRVTNQELTTSPHLITNSTENSESLYVASDPGRQVANKPDRFQSANTEECSQTGLAFPPITEIIAEMDDSRQIGDSIIKSVPRKMTPCLETPQFHSPSQQENNLNSANPKTSFMLETDGSTTKPLTVPLSSNGEGTMTESFDLQGSMSAGKAPTRYLVWHGDKTSAIADSGGEEDDDEVLLL